MSEFTEPLGVDVDEVWPTARDVMFSVYRKDLAAGPTSANPSLVHLEHKPISLTSTFEAKKAVKVRLSD